MKTYLVGGAVRDQLLGLNVTDRDWVVTGATPRQMKALGFRPVGKDFPVFLHPATQEEYALARTERKVAQGYHGFQFNTAPNVSLEEDLARRDLTINALAQDDDGNIIDYYGGQQDLQQRMLRHVSPAFTEDPVRILRVARFAARYAPLNFQVATETLALMQTMVQAGEVDALVAERVWQEMNKALGEPSPVIFLQVLQDSHALSRLLPELRHYFDLEAESGTKALQPLRNATQLTNDKEIRFAAMLLHCQHLEAVTTLCERYKVPASYRQLAELGWQYHANLRNIKQQNAEQNLQLLLASDALRRPERFEKLLLTAQSANQPPDQQQDTDFITIWGKIMQECSAINVQSIIQAGYKGSQIKQQLQQHYRSIIAQHI